MTQPASPYCFARRPNSPSWMIGPPTSPDADADDLDALAALEAAAWTDFYRLGRKALAHLARHPIAPTDDDRRTLTEAETPTAECLRLCVVARLWGETFEPEPAVQPGVELFARCGPLRGLIWLDITRDGLAGPRSFGAVQVVRLTVGPRDPLAGHLINALLAFAAEIPRQFVPPDWPAPTGPRPVSAFLPQEPQPTELHAPLLDLGFSPMSVTNDAYGEGRPGVFYVHPNGLAGQLVAHIQGDDAP